MKWLKKLLGIVLETSSDGQSDDNVKQSKQLKSEENSLPTEEMPPKRVEKSFQALPWKGNDIYLENNDKAVMAVCSSAEIAKVLAACVECYSSLNAFEGSKTRAYGKFIQDAYYLYIAMSNARIPVNSVETAFVEKAFHQFCKSLNEIVEREHLKFEDVAGVNSTDNTKAEE